MKLSFIKMAKRLVGLNKMEHCKRRDWSLWQKKIKNQEKRGMMLIYNYTASTYSVEAKFIPDKMT